MSDTIHETSLVVGYVQFGFDPPIPIYAAVIEATLTIDETWAPYVQLRAKVAIPSSDSFIPDMVDPRYGFAAELTVTKTWADGSQAPQSRFWRLPFRTSTIDYEKGVINFTAESAECLLQDYGRPESTVSTAAMANIAAIATAVVGKIAGATLDTSGATTVANAETLRWEPGMSGWQYARGPIEKAGKRLFSESGLAFYLVDAPYTVAGTVTLDETTQTTIVADARSRNGDDWADCVVITYRWTDGAGVAQVRWDTAYSTATIADVTKTLLVTREEVYPGAGGAQKLLDRVKRRGRRFSVKAVSNYSAKPGMAAAVTVPGETPVNHVIRAVSFEWPANTMTVTTREP